MRIQIVVLDDHWLRRIGCERVIESASDLECVLAAPLSRLNEESIDVASVDVVVYGMSLPVGEGIRRLQRLSRRWPQCPVLVLGTDDGSIYGRRILDAGGAGVVGPRVKPYEVRAALRVVADGDWYIPSSVEASIVSGARRRGSTSVARLLSPRELEVLCRITQGEVNREIADALEVSPKTVSTFRSRILKKLDLRNDVELTHFAIRAGLVAMSDVKQRQAST